MHTLLLLVLLWLSCSNVQPFRAVDLIVPKDGVYILSVITDPKGSKNLMVAVLVEGMEVYTAYGRYNTILGLDTAIYVKAGHKITCAPKYGMHGPESRVGIVFVSYDANGFQTVTSPFPTYSTAKPTVMFRAFLGQDYIWWNHHEYDLHTFTARNTGIHWVMIRIKCQPNKWAKLHVNHEGNTPIMAYCKNDAPLSTSAALYLTKGNTFSLSYVAGDSSLRTEATTLSYVHLEDNVATIAVTRCLHLAYTAHSPARTLHFDHDVVTNCGAMFSTISNSIRIPDNGSYVVSVRGVPAKHQSLSVDMYHSGVSHNGKVFSFHSEKGYSSGQTSFFSFRAGDVLYFEASDESVVEVGTMLSIALVWRGEPYQ